MAQGGDGVPARRALHFALLAALLCAVFLSRTLYAEPTKEQLEKIKSAEQALRSAATDYRQQNFQSAGQSVKRAQSLVAELGGAPDLDRRLAPILARLRQAHTLLEIEGVSLPPLPSLQSSTARPSQPPAQNPAGQRRNVERDSQRRQQKPKAKRPRLEIQPATGGESVQFSRDIAGILVENCFDCHAAAERDGGRLSLETFADILRGGQSGLALQPGNASGSLIVKKLRGTAGARMPLDRDPLPEAQIAAIEKWIAEGAKFDAADARQSLELIDTATRAKSATPEQLSASRAELAARNWRLAIPDEQPDTHETKHFLLLGNIGQEPLAALGRIAEEQATDVARMLRHPEDQPLIKGRITLFAFKRRSDYSEWRNVDGRDLPAAWRGHWKYTIADAYACVVTPTGDEYSLKALVAQQIAAIHVASLGRIPVWFADGVGRVTASRVDPRDQRIRGWENRIAQPMTRPWKAGDFLTGNLPPEEQSLLNYALIKALSPNPQKLQGVLVHLRKGVDFDQAFARVFGAAPSATVAAWSGRPSSASPPARRR